MNDQLKKALEMARTMDEQEAVGQASIREDNITDFLDPIGQIESSGGKNFNHRLMTSGPHKGHRAIGTYGLMPNTVDEIINRMTEDGTITDEIAALKNMSPEEKKRVIEENPNYENRLARYLAGRVLDRQHDPEKAAYSWIQGHNLTPQEIDAKNYKDHDYVKKFNRFRGVEDMIQGNRLGGKINEKP